MKKTLQINGVDYTALSPSAGYSVEYKKITGPNEGLMINGDYTEDVLAVKAIVKWLLLPLTEKQQSELLQNLYSFDYASVYYFDPRKNGYRSAVMRYEITPTKYRGNGADLNEYWTGMEITFEDRSNWK